MEKIPNFPSGITKKRNGCALHNHRSPVLPRSELDVPYTIIGVKQYNSNKPCYTGHADKGSLYLTVRIQNIVLKQDPSEVLDLEIRIDSVPTQDRFEYLYKVTNLETKFHNNLHEFDTNYIYEILCRYYIHYEDPDEYLFSVAKPRLSSVIMETEKRFSSPYQLHGGSLYIYIRRTYRYERENEVRRYIDFRSLLQNVPADITLIVEDQSLSAHLLVLSHSSDVFKSMFNTEMLEAKTGNVKIEDFRVEVIKEMLNFLYTGKIVHIKMRYELLKVAHKYQLHDLYNCCKDIIIFNSKCENIAETLEIADMYDIEQLKVSCMKFVNNHKIAISKEPSYCDYLCRAIKLYNVVDTLLFATEYNIESVIKTAFDFISENFGKLKDNEPFSKLFELNPSLMKDIFYYYCEKHTSTDASTSEENTDASK